METASSAIIQAPPDRRRWLILGTVGLAQLMVVLDTAIVNIALPSAQRSLGFTTVDRQWVVTAYALAFGSLLLLGGRLGDLIGRKTTFVAGALGFAAASAVGGAATNFGMLVAARATQGAFGALLAPAALSILSTTFSDPKERGKAFGVYGAIVGAGGAIGLLLGGILTEYLSWRWCLYVNLFFAGFAAAGGVLLLRHQRAGTRPRLDLPGAALVSAAMFCLVYGFSNAANHSWGTPSTYGFLAAGAALLAGFAFWQARAASPLLPPRVVLDRNRGGAYLAVLIAGVGMFGTSLLNTIFASAVARYLASHLSPGTLIHGRPAPALTELSLIHGYTTGFWVAAAIFGAGAVICGTLLRSGPLHGSVPAAIPATRRVQAGQRAVGRSR